MRIYKAAATSLALALLSTVASAQTVRIGMTAADIPRTLGQPDQGFEGNRFTGLTMYDALTMWDLSSETKPSVVIPGLATEWAVDAADKTKWTFKLRPGVKFHDGSAFNADAVVWNVEKVLNKDAEHYDASQVGVTASRMPTLVSARKIDDLTVELTTKEPDSFLPINLTNLFMASPAKWKSLYEAAQGADASVASVSSESVPSQVATQRAQVTPNQVGFGGEGGDLGVTAQVFRLIEGAFGAMILVVSLTLSSVSAIAKYKTSWKRTASFSMKFWLVVFLLVLIGRSLASVFFGNYVMPVSGSGFQGFHSVAVE